MDQDDDIAAAAQHVLNVIDMMLNDKQLTDHIDSDRLETVRSDRLLVAILLKNYREKLGIAVSKVPPSGVVVAGPYQGMVTPAAVGVAMLTPAEAFGLRVAAFSWPAAATALGRAAAGLGSRIVLTSAVEVLGEVIFFSQLTDEPGQGTASQQASVLQSKLNVLAQDMMELGDIGLIMAMTAEEAAKLATDELLKRLSKAMQVFAGSIVAVIIAELVKRFPRCSVHLEAVKKHYNVLHRWKTNPSLGLTQRKLIELIANLQQALSNFSACMAQNSGPGPTPGGNPPAGR